MESVMKWRAEEKIVEDLSHLPHPLVVFSCSVFFASSHYVNTWNRLTKIERFHSRGQHQCKFISLACVAARLLIYKRFFFSYLVDKREALVPGVPNGDRGNWEKESLRTEATYVLRRKLRKDQCDLDLFRDGSVHES